MRFMEKSILLLIGVAIAIVSLFWFTMIFPYKPSEMVGSKMQIKDHTIKAGNYITVTMNFKKYMDIKPDVKWYLVDGTVLQITHDYPNRPVGTNIYDVKLRIPLNAEPGTYHLQLDLDYKLFAWRNIQYSWVSEDFQIVASDSADLK